MKLKPIESVLVTELDTDRATDSETSTLSVLDNDVLTDSNPTSVVVVKELVRVEILVSVTSLPSILATDLMTVTFASIWALDCIRCHLPIGTWKLLLHKETVSCRAG